MELGTAIGIIAGILGTTFAVIFGILGKVASGRLNEMDRRLAKAEALATVQGDRLRLEELKSGVMETKLDNLIKIAERIDRRMEEKVDK